MAELPSDIIYNIFSRLPIKSLARFRCVSKLWCEYINTRHLAIIHRERSTKEPTLLMYCAYTNPPRIVSFNITKSKEGVTLLKAKTDPFMEFDWCQQSLYERPASMVPGSCNGLICLSHKVDDIVSLIVIHPLRKEWYKVPQMDPCLPLPSNKMRHESCGLGFDASTNTSKMVCVVSVEQSYQVAVRRNLCTMVHVLGTSSWRKIPQVPPYPITGECVVAHGCLHWLSKVFHYTSHYPDPLPEQRIQVVCFDVKMEEFGLINPPKETKAGCIFHKMVDLHGEVGYAYHYLHDSIEVWVLKEKEWAMHYQFDQKPPLPGGYVDVVGRWNKDGDILMQTHGRRVRLFVYNLKGGRLDEVEMVFEGDKYKNYLFMYPASDLFSIHGINANAGKLMGSCQ